MSDTETRMMRYTIEQLSAELQAKNQYITDIESKLERTRKELDIAVNALKRIADAPIGYCMFAERALEQITALEQKDVK